MNVEDKTSILGYVYFRDNEQDFKIGLTNNLVARGRAYKTENPRDTVLDYFSVETYAQAEAIEADMKRAAKAEGLCSFSNSREWLVRTEETKAFWNRFKAKYASMTYSEWENASNSEASRLKAVIAELESRPPKIKWKTKTEVETVTKYKVTNLKYLAALLALWLVAPLAFQAAADLAESQSQSHRFLTTVNQTKDFTSFSHGSKNYRKTIFSVYEPGIGKTIASRDTYGTFYLTEYGKSRMQSLTD